MMADHQHVQMLGDGVHGERPRGIGRGRQDVGKRRDASIPTPQPVLYRPMFGSFGGATASTSATFVSQASLAAGIGDVFRKRAVAVKACRSIGKRDMVHNSATPKIEVDPETYEVRADGELLTCEPAQVLPLAQRYFLF